MHRIPRLRTGKSPAQSFTEFAILLPLLAIMLSGLVEFGIMLNYYLDVIDAAREATRFAADDDPVINPHFYTNAQTLAKQSLKSASDGRIDWEEFGDCDTDIHGDIVISAFSVVNDPVICIHKGFSPPCVDKWFTNGAGDAGVSLCGHYESDSSLREAEINDKLKGNPIPNTGFVIVQIYYEYEMLLGLPWITAFVPNPITLHAYSLMPNVNAEPTPIP